MASAITKLPQTFNVRLILDELPASVLEGEEFRNHSQLCLTHSIECESWFEGVGSLYDYTLKAFTKKTADYRQLNKLFHGSYLEKVVQEVKEVASTEGVSIGRIRLMLLKPKSCYTLHRDLEDFRYHIPLTTNKQNFFVAGERVEYMHEIGVLYKVETKDYHTAVNASFEDRLHLVFDTYV